MTILLYTIRRKNSLIIMTRTSQFLQPGAGISPCRPPERRDSIGRVPSSLLLVLFLTILCSPVYAHSAAQMGVAQDQYDKGIPLYWPYHALLMAVGFGLLASGFLVVRLWKSPGRFRIHKILQTTGGGSFIAGLSVGVFMVTLSGAPQIRYSHDLLGAGIVALVALTLAIGYIISREKAPGPSLSFAHRWGGRMSIALIALNIFLGISMMAAVLAQ